VFAALDHQDLPFEKVVAALVRDRDPGRQPLFQAMFVLQNNQLAPIELPGLRLAPLPSPEVGAQVDLALSAVEAQGGIVLGLGYAADLFDPATPVRWLDALSRLLEAMVTDPAHPVSALQVLSPTERHQATVEHDVWPVDRQGAPVLLGVWGDLAGQKARVRADGSLERFAQPLPSQDRLADRKRDLAARRGQLSPEKRALLAKWVSGKTSLATPSASANPLVAIQPEGSRTPLFFVHSGHGAAHPYLELGACLQPRQPLYAFESPGLTGGALPSSLEETAASYLGFLSGVQPTGPYRLGGWCTGGVAAFEMARQLVESGEEVEILLLLDSHAPPEQPGRPSDEVELLVALARQLATTAGQAIQLAENEVRRIPEAERLPWLLRLAGERGILPSSFSLEQAERAYAVLSANVGATERYRPKPINVPTVLFRAAVQPPEAEPLPALGWERWITEPIEVITTAGDHGALLREPGVAGLAAAILASSLLQVPLLPVADGRLGEGARG
jgi:thioesterase domain-containing protein